MKLNQQSLASQYKSLDFKQSVDFLLNVFPALELDDEYEVVSRQQQKLGPKFQVFWNELSQEQLAKFNEPLFDMFTQDRPQTMNYVKKHIKVKYFIDSLDWEQAMITIVHKLILALDKENWKQSKSRSQTAFEILASFRDYLREESPNKKEWSTFAEWGDTLK